MDDNDIAGCVRNALAAYFQDLDGEEPSAIYEMVIGCIERSLIGAVLQKADWNQTRAAEMLGLSRQTLRKKMKRHALA